MLILCLLVSLILLTFFEGFFTAGFVQWGFTIVNFRLPFYNIGISYHPYEYHSEKGEVYGMKSLRFGFMIMTLYFDFYTYKGTKETVKENDITTKSPSATI